MKNTNTSYYSLSAYSTAADALNTLHRFFSFDPHKNFIILLRILCYYFHFTYKKTSSESWLGFDCTQIWASLAHDFMGGIGIKMYGACGS